MEIEYDPKVLRKLQLSECAILEDFIKICEENNINYFIYAGCAIGVERHQGFIPWDDDIDIGMLREDYNKFIEIAQKEYYEKYEILEIGLDDKFPFLNAEFKRRGTRNVPAIFRTADVDMGICVALYPFDNVCDNKRGRKKQMRSVFFWHKIKILREFGRPVLFIQGWKRKLVSVTCIVAHSVLKICHISHRFINKHYINNATKYNDKETEYVSCYFATTPTENYIKRSDIFPLQRKKFEYLEVNVPRNNHDFLTRKFGDYMKLPPKEKRKNHVPYILEFGPFDNIKIEK